MTVHVLYSSEMNMSDLEMSAALRNAFHIVEIQLFGFDISIECCVLEKVRIHVMWILDKMFLVMTLDFDMW